MFRCKKPLAELLRNFPSWVDQIEKLTFHWEFHRFGSLPERSGPNDQLLITARLSFDPE
jgi:hypothetical protein